MRGTTHFKTGCIYYGLYTMVPIIPAIPIIGKPAFSILGMLVAGTVSLFADADEKNSKINRMNPITGLPIMCIESVAKILKVILKLALTTGIGILMLVNFSKSVEIISVVPLINKNPKMTTFLIAVVFIFLGFTHESIMKRVPFIGTLYTFVTELIRVAANTSKRVIIMLVYVTVGVILLIYNFKHENNVRMYLISGLLIAAGIFRHRSVLHSLDGFVVFVISASYVLKSIGHYEYMAAVFVGYFTHLILTDMLTNSGIPLSMIPTILETTRLHELFKKNDTYMKIYTVLDFKLKVPIMSTGSDSGNAIEMAYISVLLCVLIFSFLKYSPHINII